MKEVKVGIIGTGFTIGIAKNHVDAYEANGRAELVALYDIIPGRSAEWAKKYSLKDVKICESVEELLSIVDAVSICTPNSTHVDLTIKALEAGKHVICEKPFTTSYEEGVRAVECAKKHPELIAMIGFNYREIPAVKYMKKMIDEGKMGKVYFCRQELGGHRIANPTGVFLEWRMQEQLSGTGALADFGCHMLDLTDYLLADSQGKISEVSAMTNTFIKERTIIGEDRKGPVTNDDCAVFNAKTEGGTLLSFVSSRMGVSKHMLEINAEGGMMSFYGDRNKVYVMLKDKNSGYGSTTVEEIHVPEEMKGEEEHKGLINDFIAAILDGKTIDRNLERGLYIQYILDSLRKSADEGRNVAL
jgi:predicted dehydrogenase